jgi:cytochrome bd-type quinol oxidase subunit 2
MEITHHMSTMIIFWVAIFAIVFVGNFFAYRSRVSHHRMIETLAEKGQTIPPDYLRYGRRSWRYGHPVASGIYLMCIGVALAVFFWAMSGGGNPFGMDGDLHGHDWLPFIGIFPFMVGLARVITGMFDRPQPRE